MTDKTFDIVGVSTNGKQTKFRTANGDLDARVKVLERNGHTEINLMKLDAPMGKVAAIEAFKAKYPEYANVRMPNEKPASTATKTVKLDNKTDAGTAVLADEAAETAAVTE